PLDGRAILRVGDLEILVECGAAIAAEPPPAHTETLLQAMLTDAGFNSDLDRAYLEVMAGPAKKKRVSLPDGFESGEISSDPSALIRLAHISSPLILRRVGDRFMIEPGQDTRAATGL